MTPFLYENSDFYRRRFDRLGLAPTDIQNVDDLPKWPVVDKAEMMADVEKAPPYGTYSTHDDELWAERGWMIFSSSGSTGVPRVFRYSQIDREYWAWANARAMHSHGIRPDDSVLICSGYGPHVFAWGVQFGLAKMGVPTIPGGGMTGEMRARIVDRFKPTVICGTTSYALHLGRVMEELGLDPAASSVKRMLVGGEPGTGIKNTRDRLQGLWDAEMVEFYGCTEASPHCGGYSCPASEAEDGTVTTHLMEDIQIWELVDADSQGECRGGRAGPDGMHLSQLGKLTSVEIPGRRLHHLHDREMRLRPHPRPCRRIVLRAGGRSHQSPRQQDVPGPDRRSGPRGTGGRG